MVNGDEKLSRLKRQQRSKEAIDLAMQGRWREAVEVNQEIIQNVSGDVEAYNRLGRAYLELGEYNQSKEAYGRSIQVDPFNAIARKNLQKLKYLEGARPATEELHKVDPQNFIEEMGKAGVVRLLNPAPKEVMARMVAGDVVNLRVAELTLVVEDVQGQSLGEVDPRHAQRLIKLMEGGNKYSAAVVSSSEAGMTVVIRETYQDPSQAGRPSFPPRGLEEVRPYASDRILKVEAEEEGAEEPGYTIIGGGEVEGVLPEESSTANEDTSGDE